MKTVQQILNNIYAAIEPQKISKNTKLVRMGSDYVSYYNLQTVTASDYRFGSSFVTGSGNVASEGYNVRATGSMAAIIQIAPNNSVSFSSYANTVYLPGNDIGLMY